MKFRRQVHNVRIPAPAGDLDDKAMEALIGSIEQAYEKIYGKGTAYRKAGVEVSNFIVTATTKTYKPKLKEEEPDGASPQSARIGERQVYFDGFIVTPVFKIEKLRHGNIIHGPAVVDSPATSLLLHPGQTASVDRYRNLLVKVG